MKKNCSVIFLIFILTTTILNAHSLESHRTVKVGFFAFTGYHIVSSDGAKSGYGYDFLQQLARYTNWDYEYIGYDKSWNEMQQMLADGEIDLLTSAQKTPDREAQFAFSTKPIGTSVAILTARSGDERFIPGDYKTYNGMKVGMIKGNSRNENLEQFSKEHNFSYTPVYFSNTDALLSALHHDKSVDALLTSNLRSIKNEWILDQFNPSNFYVMTRKNDTKLLAEINTAIDQMDMNNVNWRDTLWDTYYKADSGEEISFSAEERQFIKAAQKNGTVFTAIVNPDRSPYSYFTNGKAEGIMPELFSEIQRRTGLSFKIIETKDRKNYQQAIKQHDIDVRIDTYANYYNAECSGFKLTDPYITTSITRITKKSFSGKPNSIAVLQYADYTSPYKTFIDTTRYVHYFLNTNDCIQAVYNGEVDAAYIYTYTAQQIINDDVQSRLTATIYPQYKVSFAIGVSTKQDNCLLTILNKSVDSINTGFTEQTISEQTAYQKRTISFVEYLISHPGVAVVFFATITIILVMLLIFFMRQKNMRILQNKNDELALAITRADKASQAKSKFLSRMSHEMRTPMNAIVGITAIAKDHTNNPEKIGDYLNKIDSSSHLLLSIINDVLDMSAIENNKITITNEPFSLSNCFSAINTLYDVQCRNKGISFILSNKANIDSLMGDQLRLNQILLNLVSNAYKFTEKGGSIQLSAESFPLVPEQPVQKKTYMIQFTVSDTGCGMTEEMLSRLFQPFEQESSDTAQKYGGSGLGLAITKSLVTLMKGTISVQSKKLQGTTFTVLIPFEQNSNEGNSVTTSNKYLHNKTDFSGKHFLLAEDNELNREVAVELLSSTKAQIDTAIDGQMAVDIFKNSASGTYDLILMDMQMPKLDGIEATKQIRALNHPQAKTIPILAMTANAYKEDIDACLEAGMNGHLAKPIEPTLLYNSISSFLL